MLLRECARCARRVSRFKFWIPTFVVCATSSHATRLRLPPTPLKRTACRVGVEPHPQVHGGVRSITLQYRASATRPPTSRTEVLNPAGLPAPAGFPFQITIRTKPTPRQSKSSI
jgi:hypothetical protein